MALLLRMRSVALLYKMWMLGVCGSSSSRFAEEVEALLGALGHPPANIQGGVVVAAPAAHCSNLSHGCC